MIDKDKLLELAKNRGIDLAEDAAEQLAKGGAHLLLDILEEMAAQSENKMDDVAVAAVMGPARKMADGISVKI